MKLTRKHISFFPTAHGFLFLGILAGMLAGSINYNNNAGFMLVFLLGGMAVISLFHSFGNLAGIEIDPLSPGPVFAGTKALFPIRLRAKGGQGCSLEFSLASQETLQVSIDGETTLQMQVPAEKRGMLALPALTLSSVYPLGLFRLTALLPAFGTACLVYPTPEPGPLRTAQGGASCQEGEKSIHSGVDDFQGLKQYQPGHSVGRIAWKALSRGRGVFVKDFTAEANPWVMLDFRALPGQDLEHKLSLLCAMVVLADQRKMAYGLKLPPAFIKKPSTGSSHKHHCLGALALFTGGSQ